MEAISIMDIMPTNK